MNILGKARYKKLAGALVKCADTELERRVFPYFLLLNEDVCPVPRRGQLDRAGVDLAAGTGPCFEVVVQCKGTLSSDAETLAGTLRSIGKSVAKFRDSGFSTKQYILLHTVTGKLSADFATQARELCERLRIAGVSEHCDVWSINDFIVAIGKQAHSQLASFIKNAPKTLAAKDEHIVSDVPYSVSLLGYNQAGFYTGVKRPAARYHGDALEVFQWKPKPEIYLVLGEYGMGKTSLARRYTGKWSVFMTPAAVLSANISQSKNLLARLIDIDRFLERYDPKTRSALSDFLEPIAENFLLQNDNPLDIALLVDGLDESPFLAGKQGLALLLDALSHIRVPVVLTMRTEFWAQRRVEFSGQFSGRQPSERAVRNREIRIIALESWERRDIQNLTKARQADAETKSARAHYQSFLRLIESSKYEDLYGDIPRTPFFLQLILDRVALEGPAKTKRAELMLGAIRAKLYRDSQAGHKGHPSRGGILAIDEPVQVTMRLSMIAMRTAANLMFSTDYVLQPTCTLSELKLAAIELAPLTDPSGLFLNSLLMPIDEDNILDTSQSFRFSHFSFQEFLTAYNLLESSMTDLARVPASVRQWMNAIGEAGLLRQRN